MFTVVWSDIKRRGSTEAAAYLWRSPLTSMLHLSITSYLLIWASSRMAWSESGPRQSSTSTVVWTLTRESFRYLLRFWRLLNTKSSLLVMHSELSSSGASPLSCIRSSVKWLMLIIFSPAGSAMWSSLKPLDAVTFCYLFFPLLMYRATKKPNRIQIMQETAIGITM